jgi:hypothetical protein
MWQEATMSHTGITRGTLDHILGTYLQMGVFEQYSIDRVAAQLGLRREAVKRSLKRIRRAA